MSSVTVDETFKNSVDRLTESVRILSNNLWIGGRIPWFKLGDNAILDGFDYDQIATAFSRNGTSKAYANELVPNGSYRNAQAAKVQGDVLSAFERDWRMRARSRVRMLAHAASRSRTHGLAAGPIQGNILQYVRLLIDSGPSE